MVPHDRVTFTLPVIAAILVAASLGACGSSGQPRASDAPGAASTRSLHAEEIRAAGAVTGLDAVRRLRPEWLRARGPTSLTDQINAAPGPAIVVYLDGIRFGGLESLQSLRAEEILLIDYLEGAAAAVRYGTGHEGGAILVRTR